MNTSVGLSRARCFVRSLRSPKNGLESTGIFSGSMCVQWSRRGSLSGLHMGFLWYEGYGVTMCGASYDCQMPHSLRPVHLRAFLEPLRADPH